MSRRHDYHTSTVDGAAAFARWEAEDNYYRDYDPYDDYEGPYDGNDLWSRLSGAGYEPDDPEYPEGIWSRKIRSSVHTCRRDHKDGRVKVGDRYRVTTDCNVNGESGKSWLSHSKTVIERA